MKKAIALCLSLLLLLPLVSCTVPDESYAYDFFVMDTVLTVTVYQNEASAALANACCDIATEIENKASRTLATSEVYAFNRAEKDYTFSEDMAMLIREALAMCDATKGAYDITVAPLVELWNVTNGGPVPTEEEIETALEKVSYKQLTLEGNTLKKASPEVMIDLGSAAKGYALGLMRDYLERAGAVATVNFGGNVALVGQKAEGAPWKISLRDPFSGGTKGKLSLTSGIVSVSGDYERYFEEEGVRYHHILSPFDGYPAKGVHSVAVIAENALQADLLSTALFVMGEEEAKAFYESAGYEFAYIMTVSREKTVASDNIKDHYTP